jgi:hypothetical protein
VGPPVIDHLQAGHALQELLVLAMVIALAMGTVLLQLLCWLLGPGCTAAGLRPLGLKVPVTAAPSVWGQL